MTGLHGKQHDPREVRLQRIMRLIDRMNPTAGDRLVLYGMLFGLGFIVGMLVFGR